MSGRAKRAQQERQEEAELERVRAELARADINLNPDILVLEYMERGELEQFLHKAGEAKQPFPDRILWEIFRCCKCARALSHAKGLPSFPADE